MRLAPLLLISGLVLALSAGAGGAQEPVAHGSGHNPGVSPMRPPASPHNVLAPSGYVVRRALPDSVLLRIEIGRAHV